MAPALNAAADRIVDLLPISRAHYYHPDMHGSWKIKVVLPTIALELAYGDLEVRNGVQAQQVFAEPMNPDLPDARRTSLRESLLSYCERDTLAMVKVAPLFECGAAQIRRHILSSEERHLRSRFENIRPKHLILNLLMAL